MFDIGFWEIAIIGVIALIVIGPEKLPSVARNVGAWVGKGKRLISSVQTDINRELNKAEELKNLLEEQKKIVEKHEILEELKKEIPLGSQPVTKVADTSSQKNKAAITSDTNSTNTTDTNTTITNTTTEPTPDQQNEQPK